MKSEFDITKIFGEMVFDDETMKERLPKAVYNSFVNSVNSCSELNNDVAEAIAVAMKDWAIEKGAKHFTHWFQPMTGITAEKHDSFISLNKEGKAIMDFSGKELIKGEPDASSFPSGGIRATFEARGYTAWDPTSYAFVKDDTLCIPTVFFSYGGEVLDKKTPLLRSIVALNKQVMRILKIFGHDDIKKVYSTVGAEQEYFLIDKKIAKQRKDLIYCGRTLYGAKPPKGQDVGEHYFGTLRPRVSKFMKDLDYELWRLGVPVKTEHNEVAPAQHELAQIYTHVNLATDQNQITMEVLKVVAEKHDMLCLLHEKPFKGINGSGKHNNWSIQTDTGLNLFEPGNSPNENAQFLLFLCAVIKGVDEYADLLRISAASAGNDHRLGGDEAPPSIVSIFIGEELMNILNSIEEGVEYNSTGEDIFETGIDILPKFLKDTTDRNRTSPFAFTGNKFEFRMLGSGESIASVNMILNTIMADELLYFADRLESSDDMNSELQILLAETIKKHKRVIFNGNNYSKEWEAEAKRRGLPILETTPDAVKCYANRKNIELFERHKILSEKEIKSRIDIQIGQYFKVITREAFTMIEMAVKEILPSIIKYISDNSISINELKKANLNLKSNAVEKLVRELCVLADEIDGCINELKDILHNVPSENQKIDAGNYCKDKIIPSMKKLREHVDKAESITSSKYWPYPDYGKILFSI